MLRLILLLAGIGLAAYGGLFWFEAIDADSERPVSTTLADVQRGKRVYGEGHSFADKKYVRLSGIELDLTRAVAGELNRAYLPVQGTEDRVYVQTWNWIEFPKGPTSLVGYQVLRPEDRLPDELEERARRGELFLITDENQTYRRHQEREAGFWFLLAAGAVAVAGLLHLVALADWVSRRRELASALSAPGVHPGPCSVCATTSALVPLSLEVETRRRAGATLVRVTTATLSLDCCPGCSERLVSLWKVRLAAQVVGVALVFAAALGVALLFLGGWPGAVLLGGALVGYLVMHFWMRGIYNRRLGHVHTRLRNELGVSRWSLLGDRIVCRRREPDLPS